jgi:hypothetical protein
MLVACCPCWNVCGGDRYVTLKGGAFYSTELPVKPGDKIFGNMTRIGPSSYFIGTCGQRLSVVDVATGVMTLSCADSVSTDTGKRTSLVQSNSRLVTQPWAYVTLEYVNDWNVSGVRLWVRPAPRTQSSHHTSRKCPWNCQGMVAQSLQFGRSLTHCVRLA